DAIVAGLQECGFTTSSPDGAYYVMAGIEAFGADDDVAFARRLIEEVAVATVPASSFYHERSLGRGHIRFSFPKKLDTIELGLAGFPGCGSGAAWSDSRPQPEQHVLARAPRRAEPRTSGPRAAPVASCPWRDGRDEALRRDGGAARCSARRTRRGFAGSGLALFRRHRD